MDLGRQTSSLLEPFPLSNRQVEVIHPLQHIGRQNGQKQKEGKDRNFLKAALIALSGIQKFDSHVSSRGVIDTSLSSSAPATEVVQGEI
jgi:hypothetical protein